MFPDLITTQPDYRVVYKVREITAGALLWKRCQLERMQGISLL
jgi:hypothetical protein